MTPRYGWYGDDFTGATDTLATLATAGQRAMLFLGVPEPHHLRQAGPLDAIGIAGAARSMDPAGMRRELDPVGRFLAALGVSVLHYKCCSTFDSAPNLGSIGVAIEVLRAYVSNPFVPILGGQPNIGRYCAFSTLFARAGAEGPVSRLDRHPTMSMHPVTPMHEADLRRHLGQQGCTVAGVHLSAYEGAGEFEAALRAASGAAAVLFDLVSPNQLSAIGHAIWQRAMVQPLLAVGPSSVAQALLACWDEGVAAGSTQARLGPSLGPVLVLAGSLSPVTRRQVEAAGSFTRVAIDTNQLLDDPAYRAVLAGEIAYLLRQGQHVLAYTASGSGPADTSRAGQVAEATARLLPAILQQAPVRRVGIAGGDTSSLAAAALGVWGLCHTATLAPGVAVCVAHSDHAVVNGVELMLKGGQMGPNDIFEHLITGLATEDSRR